MSAQGGGYGNACILYPLQALAHVIEGFHFQHQVVHTLYLSHPGEADAVVAGIAVIEVGGIGIAEADIVGEAEAQHTGVEILCFREVGGQQVDMAQAQVPAPNSWLLAVQS